MSVEIDIVFTDNSNVVFRKAAANYRKLGLDRSYFVPLCRVEDCELMSKTMSNGMDMLVSDGKQTLFGSCGDVNPTIWDVPSKDASPKLLESSQGRNVSCTSLPAKGRLR